MRRPAVLIGVGTAAGTAAVCLAERSTIAPFIRIFGVLTAAAFLAALICLFCRERKQKTQSFFFLFLLFFLLSEISSGIHCWKQDALFCSAGEMRDLKGLVLSAEESGEKWSLLLETEEHSRLLLSLRFNKSTEEKAAIRLQDIVGHTIFLQDVKIEVPPGRRNPKGFDYALYLRASGIRTTASYDYGRAVFSEFPYGMRGKYLQLLSQRKEDFKQKFRQVTGEESAAWIAGMLFGETEGMDEEVYSEFRRNGTAHVLAVSGLHVGAVYGVLRSLFRSRKSILTDLILTFLLLSYAALASFSPSVVRAVSMIFLHRAAEHFHRRYDLLSAGCVTMTIALFRNPFLLFHAGFQLSYLALFSIAIVCDALKKSCGSTGAMLLGIQLGLAPLSAYLFNTFSLGAFFANLPIVFLAGLILPVGLVAFAASFQGGFLFAVSAKTAALFCEMMTEVNRIIYAGGRFCFDTVSPEILFLVLYYGILFGACSEIGRIRIRQKNRKCVSCFLLSCLLVGTALQYAAEDGFRKAPIVFVDVGQGDCLHLRTDENRHYLIDGGGALFDDIGERVLKPYLLKNGVREIDTAFVSHLHTDHFDGIASLCRLGMVRKICVYEGNAALAEELSERTGLPKERILGVKAGDEIRLGEKSRIIVLAPPKAENMGSRELLQKEDENRTSLIFRVEHAGISIMMNGDISQEGEKELLRTVREKELLRCTVLKAAHHGSRYSSCDEFLEAVSPRVMVFQVGKNRYGHPDKSLIEKCGEKGIITCRNDQEGAIGFFPFAGGIRIVTIMNGVSAEIQQQTAVEER